MLVWQGCFSKLGALQDRWRAAPTAWLKIFMTSLFEEQEEVLVNVAMSEGGGCQEEGI
jgi:hypothetical protein